MSGEWRSRIPLRGTPDSLPYGRVDLDVRAPQVMVEALVLPLPDTYSGPGSDEDKGAMYVFRGFWPSE